LFHLEGISRYGAIPLESGRGLPTALPAGHRLVLGRDHRVGFRRYERVFTRDHSRAGQAELTRQGISLELLLVDQTVQHYFTIWRAGYLYQPPYVAVGSGPSLHLIATATRWSAYGL